MDDRKLAEDLRAQAPMALEAIMERYMRDVYGVVARVLPSGAPPEEIEEASSQAFIAAWKGARRYDPARAPLRTWLLMHAKYAALEHRRRAQRWSRALRSERGLSPPDPFEALAAQEQRSEVQAALAHLPMLDREIVYRRYFLEQDIDRMGKELGLSRGAVDNRLWRARNALRELLTERIDGEGEDASGPR